MARNFNIHDHQRTNHGNIRFANYKNVKLILKNNTYVIKRQTLPFLVMCNL